MAESKVTACTHDNLDVRLCCPSCGEEFERRTVSRAEMESQATDLPDREAMSLINPAPGFLGPPLPSDTGLPSDPRFLGPPIRQP
jgi:hypothetical protein